MDWSLSIYSIEPKKKPNPLPQHTQIDELVGTIDGQIGTSTSKYNLAVKPEIHMVAETDAGTINEFFSPNLTIGFKQGTPELNYISIENLEHTRLGTITETHQVFLQWVVNWRIASFLATVVTIPLLAITIWFYIKTKPAKPTKKPIEKIIAPHEEIIIDVATEPSYKDQRATLTMKSLEDLVNLADGLAKPVFHLKKPAKPPSKEPTHVFYVLDGLSKYEYAVTAHSVTKKED